MARTFARILAGTVLCACGFTLGSTALAQTQKQPAPQQQVRPELVYLDHEDVTPVALRDMKIIPPDWLETREQSAPKKWPHHHPLLPKETLAAASDPALQSPVGPLVGTTPGLNFDGVGIPNYTVNSAPPDTNGAIGATQYVQWVNTAFAVFNKTTGAMVLGPANGNTLWQGFGGRCETDNDGDPIVLYDKAANRWLMTQFSVSATPFFQCIAVSTSSDATGTWRRFSYSFTDFNDYPKAGVWPDGYYITYNMFNAAGTAFLGSKVCAYDRNQMITASGTPGAQQCFQLSPTFGGLLPSDLDGTTAPPAGASNYVVAFDDTNLNGLNLWKFHVNWTTPASSTFTGPTKITSTAFTEACSGGTCVTQPSTTNQLDSLADRLMYRLAYRNLGDHESLVVNHSVNVSGHSGVRWYEIRSPGGTPTLFQQGTFSPDTNHRWMGSIAMDRQGNMLMGYSVSSTTVRPSVRYTGRLATDAVNTMQTETELFAGVGSQTGGLTRWGDYSTMTVDPVDDCTFWYTQEYLKATGSFNWSTRIGSFKFPSCGTVATPDFSLACSPSSLSVQQGNNGASTCTVTSTGGFNAAVALDCASLPTGISCAYAPASVTPPANSSTTSALTIGVASATAPGSYSFQARGTSGSTVHTANISLTVTPTPVPDFSVACSPSSLTVQQGASGSSTCTVSSTNAFASAVALACGTGLPAGATCAFVPTSVTPPGNGSVNSALTLTLTTTATIGTSTLQITATSGSTVHTANIALTVTAPGPVFQDDFETNKGWTTNPNGTDTATTGRWERGDPEATTSGGVALQLGTTKSGLNDLVTARLAGAAAGTNDVDGGTTSIQSPLITLPSTGTTTLTFQYYLAHLNNSSSADFFRASVVVGTTATQVFQSLGAAVNRPGVWTPVSVNLTAFAGQSIRLRFEAADAATGSLVEAGVDDVKIAQP